MRAMPRPSKFSPAARARFCEVLTQTCVVGKACEAVGISRQTAYDHRAKDKDFAAAWDEALETAVDTLEQEAWRRAVVGVDEPIVYEGVITGTVRRYSDELLILLLRAHRPDKYRDTRRVKVSAVVKVGDGPIAEVLRSARIAALMAVEVGRVAPDQGSDLHRIPDPPAVPTAQGAQSSHVGTGEGITGAPPP